MTPGVVKHGDIIVIVRGMNALLQSMFDFANGGCGCLLFVFKSRQVPSRPDLVQSDVDDYMCESDRVFIAGRQPCLNRIVGSKGASVVEKNLLINVKAHYQTRGTEVHSHKAWEKDSSCPYRAHLSLTFSRPHFLRYAWVFKIPCAKRHAISASQFVLRPP